MRSREPADASELHALVDGQLAPERRQAIEAYLARHPEEAAAVASWESHARALKEAFDGTLSEPLPRRLAVAWLDRRLAVERFTRPSALVAVTVAALLLGVAFGLAVALLAWGEGPPNVAASPEQVFVDAALTAHRVFAGETQRPVELGPGEVDQLQHWFSARLDYPVAVPNLSAKGFRLLGGRLLSGPAGPAALILYQTQDGARVSVLATKVPGAPDSVFAARTVAPTTTVWWVDEETGFAVTAALPADTVRSVAADVLHALARTPDRRAGHDTQGMLGERLPDGGRMALRLPGDISRARPAPRV